MTIASLPILAQGQNQVVSVGTVAYPNPPVVAPGSVLTLVTTALNVPDAVATQIPLPNSLSGVTVQARVIGATDTRLYPTSLPILRIFTQNPIQMPEGVYCPTNPNSAYCSNTQITGEIPTEGVCAPTVLQGNPPKPCNTPPFNDLPPLLILNVIANGITGPDVPLHVENYAPRLLNSCDSMFGPQSSACHPQITHADGNLVSNSSPAKVGEVITVHAVGFGQNFAATGYAVPVPVQVGGSFGLTFEYSYPLADYPTPPRAQAYSTAAISVQADWIGPVVGYVGLYQINITVPPAPGQVYQPCGSNGNADVTFSLNSGTLYFCVQL